MRLAMSLLRSKRRLVVLKWTKVAFRLRRCVTDMKNHISAYSQYPDCWDRLQITRIALHPYICYSTSTRPVDHASQAPSKHEYSFGLQVDHADNGHRYHC